MNTRIRPSTRLFMWLWDKITCTSWCPDLTYTARCELPRRHKGDHKHGKRWWSA